MPVENQEQMKPAAAARDGAKQSPGAGARYLAALSLLLAGATVPAWVASRRTPPPQIRDIHIEAYRYGFSPARIHANRGDLLRLTFSTRDTGQSFFLQDYGLHVAITPGDQSVSVQDLRHPDTPPKPVRTVEIVAGLPGWRGCLTSKSQFRNHTYNGPLHGTERGDLIVAPNILLWAGLGLLAAIPFAGVVARRGIVRRFERRFNLFDAVPRLKRAVRDPSFPFNLALPMLGLFWVVILAGLLGTKVSGRNAGPMVVWVLWLCSLIVLLAPLGGRIWCTVCPLPLAGEWLQRARLSRSPGELDGQYRRILGVPLQWPVFLSNAWPRVVLFLLLGTFSTSIVAVPAATSWMLIGLMLLAVLVSVFPEQRIFCRHLCPINSYISLYAGAAPLMVRSVSHQTCGDCSERFCLTGSVKGWGCPYGLCVAELDRNTDCGLCMECVKTCAYDNVAAFWRTSGGGQKIAGYGEAWQAIVMFALACLYCYLNLGAWDWLRKSIDIVDQKHWGNFAIYASVVWMVCLGVLPLLWYALTRAGIAIGGAAVVPKIQFRNATAALIPIGLGCWIAFALATASSMMTFVLQSLSDPFNWGWNLLGMAGSRWHILWAPAIPWLQVACVLAGAAFSLRTLYRCWGTIRGCLPLGSLLWASAAGMIWFFAA
jgi:hypothetical protein